MEWSDQRGHQSLCYLPIKDAQDTDEEGQAEKEVDKGGRGEDSKGEWEKEKWEMEEHRIDDKKRMEEEEGLKKCREMKRG